MSCNCPVCNGYSCGGSDECLYEKIARLTHQLERIRDGKICRRCIQENANGFVILDDEDGSPHDCAREIAREALDEVS